MSIGRVVLGHGRGVALAMALVVVAGAIAYVRLPSGLYPELSFPRISVVGTLPDATSEIVLRNVTRPLEEALMPVLGVRRVRSKTIRGACELDLLFSSDADMIVALQLVQARLAELRADLPAEAIIVAERITPTSFPIFTLNVDGNVPPTQLRDLALYELRPALSRVPGVGPITVTAGDEREIEVEVDPARAEAAGLTVAEIARRLSETNRFGTVGRIDRAYRRYAIVVRTAADSLGDVVVGGTDRAPVRLADVARIVEGEADPHQLVRSPHGPAVVLNVSRRVGGDVPTLDTALVAEVERLKRTMPPGVSLGIVYQQATLIETATGAVRDAILLGALLSALVIYFFLRNVRATLIAALTIPASLLCACAALYVWHGSLNLMSLGGMAVAVGLVIDDAVVVVEAIFRELRAGLPPREAAEVGVSVLAGPVLSSTITTVVVFAPLAFLSGVVGTFFASLALALAASVIASLLLAFTVVPLLASRLGTIDEPAWELDLTQRVVRRVRSIRPRTTMIFAITTIVVAVVGARFVETGFIPELDEGAYVFDYFAPIGTSLAEANALAGHIDDILRADPDVLTFTRRLGAELGPARATETSRGDVIVRLKRRHRPIDEIMEEQRALAAQQIPGVRVELIQLMQDMLGDLEGSPEPVEVKLFGPDEPSVRAQAARVAEIVRDVPGVTDLFDGQVACSPERVVQVDPIATGRVGLGTSDVIAQIAAAQLGVDSTPLAEGDRLVPVRVRWNDRARLDEHVLERVRIKTPAGPFIALDELAHVVDRCAPSEITRENLRLMVPVTARIEGRSLGAVSSELDRTLAGVTLPPGFDREIGGQRASQRDAFTSLGLAIVAALALVTLVLVLQFGSFGAALAILAALPLALGGGLLALVVTRTALNVSSLLGGILLVGLVVKNGILLLHHAREREDAGLAIDAALTAAVEVRLRPILMTTLCTLLGVLPLALGLGAGSEMHRPLAIAVLGGLSLSTIGTLLVVPSLYARLRARVGAR